MTSAKTALQQLFSWCLLNQPFRPGIVEQYRDATPPVDMGINPRPAERHSRSNAVVHRTMTPDLRQCEPWRQALMQDSAIRNDPTRHERLIR